MSYCFNLACPSPYNPDRARFCQSCGSKLLVGDRYRALHPLGLGGFGRTLLAVDEHKPSRPSCVIKQFLPQHQGTENGGKAAELFRREAIQLEPLGEHPQIPQLYAYFTEGDRQFLVQEYIKGSTLTQELAETGTFSEEKIYQLLSQLLPVLKFIHDHQVIHRDIKPDNIIRRQEDGQLFLVDFGAAKYAATPEKTGTIIGSAAYTPPEQLLGKAAYNSDLYSLGVTCLYLLTEVPPFDLFDTGENQWAWKDCLRHPIRPELIRVLDKMIYTATKYRYQSASEVLTELFQLRAGDLSGFTPISQSPSATPTVVAVPASEPETTLQTPDIKTALETALKVNLNPYWVKVQLYWGKKHLSLFLVRNPDTPINYIYLMKIIEATIRKFSLEGIETVKIYGRVSNNPMPEWKDMINLSEDFLWLEMAKNKLVHYQKPEFWLAQLEKKEFWLDTWLFGLMVLLLTHRIILLHPLFGWLVAIAFMVVKTLIRDQPEFQEARLYKHWLIMGTLLWISDSQVWISSVFGVMIAGFIVASPFLYLKGYVR